MPDYRDAINKVLEHEGGFINHPNDRGGPTNWGVTMNTYNMYMTAKTGKTYISTVDEIKKMPKALAVDIYKKLYWDKIQGDKIKKYAVAAVIFDQAINRGVSSAIKQAQKVIKALDPFGFANIVQDGVMGPKSLEALNSVSEKPFLDSYLRESTQFYQNIVNRDPSQSVFLQGWLNRIKSLNSYATAFYGSVNATAQEVEKFVKENKVSLGVIILFSVGGYLFWKYGIPMLNSPDTTRSVATRTA